MKWIQAPAQWDPGRYLLELWKALPYHDRQWKYNISLKRFRVTIFIVEKQ